MLAVVANHLLQRPSGGYVGVDIFFVISGYLITGILWREYEDTGRIRLLQFYRRRVKRTLPAAVLVIVFTVIAGGLLLPFHRLQQLLATVFSAATFWVNWLLVAQGTDYLHATDLPTALQHYWSLAVEEQFYLVWPTLIIAMIMIAARMGFNRRATAVVAVGLVAATSVAWAALQTAADPTAAYFSTFTRAWELGAGALLALAAPVVEKLSRYVRSPLSWTGLALILYSFVRLDPDSAFPFPWAIVPVVGALAVLAAGEGHSVHHVYPLTNRMAGYVGRISYSLYLWHYPVIIFITALLPTSRIVDVLALVIMLALSVASFHWIEEPLRTRSWRFWRAPRLRPRFEGVKVLRAGSVVAVLIVSFSALALVRAPEVASAAPLKGLYEEGRTSSAAQSLRQDQIREALSAPTWPSAVRATIDSTQDLFAPQWVADRCLWLTESTETPTSVKDRCVFGDPRSTHVAIVYGDSIAISYLPAVVAALRGSDWRIEVMTAEQCPAVQISVLRGDGAPYPQCDSYHRWALNQIKIEHPDVVVMASTYTSVWRLAPGANVPTVDASWTASTRRTVQSVASRTGRLVVLDAPPKAPAVRDCLTLISRPSGCVGRVSPVFVDVARDQRHAVRESEARNVTYPSTVSWFCDAQGYCPAFVNGVVSLADGEHPSNQDATQLGGLLRALWPGA